MRKNSLSVRCFAKINTYLEVLNRRADGFHQIVTRYISIDLHDRLKIELGGKKITLSCDKPELPTDESNLVVQAAGLFQQRIGLQDGFHFTLEKRIPTMAGLGGGSSDAAATLKALNILHKEPFALNELSEMAAEVGSDVPYFLIGGHALGRGRGEILDHLADVPKMELLLIKPKFGIAAKQAYKYFDLTSSSSISDSSTICERPSWMSVPETQWRNDLEGGVFAQYPELKRLKELLLVNGAEKAIMCGSGSTVAARFGSRETAEKVANILIDGGVNIIQSSTISRDQFLQRFVIDSD